MSSWPRMGNRRPGEGRLTRAVASAAAFALAAAALAGGGPARAVASPAAGPDSAGPGTISTAAGGVGGPAKATRVAIGVDKVSFSGGNLYVAGNYVVRQVNTATDRLTTPAGSGFGAPVGDGGLATEAGLTAQAAAADSAGNLVIADLGNRIRVVAASTGTFYGQAMTARHIYTIAGTGKKGFSGDGGPATSAEFDRPADVAVGPSGNVIIADEFNQRVRVVAESTGTFYGVAMTAGDIYTIAGTGTAGYSGDGGPAASARLDDPTGVAVDGAGNVIIADSSNSRIRVVAASTGTFYGQAMTAGDIYTVAGDGSSGFSGDGGPATSAALSGPEGASVDGAGNLLIADSGNNRIRVVAESTGTFYGQAMTAGDIYAIAGNGTAGFAGDDGVATRAELNNPEDVTVDGAGNVVIADSYNNRVRVVAESTGTFYKVAMTAGHIYTVAGRNGLGLACCVGLPATAGQLEGLQAVTVDRAGNLVIGKWTEIEVAAAASGTFYGQQMTAGGLYAIAGTGYFGSTGDGGPATSAEVNTPNAVVVDGAGNVVFADDTALRVRVIAESTGTFYGVAMTAGDIYTIAGTGVDGYSGDGGPATSAEISGPQGLAIDSSGNLLISDSQNQRIRVVAASTGTFYGQAMTAGDIYTIAGDGTGGFSGDGGPATSAELNFPGGLAVDSAGNVIIADGFNERVRVVAESTGTFYGQAMTAGDIYTIAGDGTQGYAGDGGPATSAELSVPGAIAVDSLGNVIFADSGNRRIRVVAARTGTFYGVPMTAGDIYTVAGNGKLGGKGDGGPATRAEFVDPTGVAVTGTGNLAIADFGTEDGWPDRVQIVQG